MDNNNDDMTDKQNDRGTKRSRTPDENENIIRYSTDNLSDLLVKYESGRNVSLYEKILYKIQNKEFNYDGINNSEFTAHYILIYLMQTYSRQTDAELKRQYENFIIAIINTGESNPGKPNNQGYTLLMRACEKKMTNIALALINTGSSNPEQRDSKGNTALMYACFRNIPEVAIRLIELDNPTNSYIGVVNHDGFTALTYACHNSMEDVGLRLVQSGNSNPGEISSLGDTALILSCDRGLTNLSLGIIRTGNSNPGVINQKGYTALIISCKYGMEEVSQLLIDLDDRNPENSYIGVVNYAGYTALIYACNGKMENVAHRLIQSGNSNPSVENSKGYNALMISCIRNMPNIALEIIRTGKSNPGYQMADGKKYTALIVACKMGLRDVAIELVNTGESNPDREDSEEKTALMYACIQDMPDVAMAIIQTNNFGLTTFDDEMSSALLYACKYNLPEVASVLIDKYMEVDPNYVGEFDSRGNTPLLMACKNGMTQIALKLFNTRYSNPYKSNKDGETVHDYIVNYIRERGDSPEFSEILTRLKFKREDLMPIEINESQRGNNLNTLEETTVKDYLEENDGNLCFILDKSCFFTTKGELLRYLGDVSNIKYKCHEAGDNTYVNGQIVGKNYWSLDNYDQDNTYFTLSPIVGARILASWDFMIRICQDSIQIFRLVPTGERFPSVMSEQSVVGGPGHLGADYCQKGKDIAVYNLEPLLVTWTQSSESTTPESLTPESLSPFQEINVQYKGRIYKFPINMSSTIGDVKEMLLDELLKGNPNRPKTVKFIFMGRIYEDQTLELKMLHDPPYGITLQALSIPSVGGKKTRGKKRLIRRQTKKQRT